MEPYILKLPVPPSLNVYYQNARRVTAGGKSYTGKMISPEGMRFRGEVATEARRGHRVPPRLAGRLRIFVFVCKDTQTKAGRKRANRWDGDNLWKCLLDALTEAKIIGDDSQFDDHRIIRGNPMAGGALWVSIRESDPDAALAAVREAGIDTTKSMHGSTDEIPF